MRRALTLLLCLPLLAACPDPEDSEPTPDPTPTPAANVLPQCELLEPDGGSVLLAGEAVRLAARGSDEDGEPTELVAVFTSDAAGDLGAGRLDEDGRIELEGPALAAGEHRIGLLVTDADGGECADEVFVVVGTPPTAEIEAPEPDDPLDADIEFELRGTVSDAEDGAEELAASWHSSRDGELEAVAPAVDGSVVLRVALSAGDHVLTLAVEDSDGLTAEDEVEVHINAVPTAPGIELSPAAPTTTDALVVTVTTDATDADAGPEALEYRIRWSDPDGPRGDLDDLETVHDLETRKGETWTVAVSAWDGQVEGPAATASVTIGNTPPTASTPTVDPNPLYADSTAECTGIAASDADPADSPTTTVTWLVDGADPGVTGATLSGAFSKGQDVQCVVTPSDDGGPGTPATSAAVPVLNSAPTQPVISAGPGSPDSFDALDCSIATASTDADGDALTYDFTWLVGGVASGYAATGESSGYVLTVPSTATAIGESWTCEVVASDGSASSGTASATVTVLCADTGESAGCPGTTCLQVLNDGYSTGDGLYWLDPLSSGTATEFECDMAGGGWTGVDFVLADTVLNGAMVAVDAAGTEGIDPVNGPYTRDGTGNHTYHYTFDWDPGVDEFYLDGWEVKANAGSGYTSDLWPNNWAQSVWTRAQSCGVTGTCGTGDISFGDPAEAGPVISYADVVAANFSCRDCVTAWPAGTTQYTLNATATQFRVGWGEGGGEHEGWYPWWAGSVFLR